MTRLMMNFSVRSSSCHGCLEIASVTDRKLDRDIFAEEFILFGQIEINEEEK